MSQRYRVVSTAATALAVILVITGCTSHANAPAVPTKTSRSLAQPTTHPTPAPVTDAVLTGSWETFDRVLISDDVFQGDAVAGTLKSGTTDVPIYVPGVGPRDVPLTADVGTGEVQNRTVNVGGSDGALMLIVETATRLPAQGLNEAGSHNQLDSYDIDTGRHIATYEFPDADVEGFTFDLIAATHGDNVAVGAASSNEADEIVGVNVRTGKKNWDQTSIPAMKTRSMEALSYGTFATTSATGGKPGDAETCFRVDGFDTATGNMLWSVDAASIPDVGSSFGTCAAVRVEALDQQDTRRVGSDFIGAYLHVIIGMSHGLGEDKSESRMYDGATGRALATTSDPRGDIDLLGGYTASQAFVTSAGPLVVADTETGKIVYTVPQDKVDDLHLTLEGAFGGWIYTKTTDGTPIIDVATGKVVADNTKNMPLQTVGKYTLYSDGTLSLNPHLGASGTATQPTATTSPTS